MQVTAEDLWNHWTRGFGQWCLRYYGGEIWKKDFANHEYTQGVFNPFVLTYLAPALSCRVRFLTKRRDAVLMDDTGKVEYAHIEHENRISEICGEIPKLAKSRPHLKCMIIPPPERTVNGSLKTMNEFMSYNLEPIVHKALLDRPSNTWMFICGIESSLLEKSDWRGFKFVVVNNKPVTIPLS